MRVQKNKLYNNGAPELARYHQGPVLTNGALEFVYEKPVAWPLYTLWGEGIRNIDQFASLQAPQLRSELALTAAPIVGPGYPAGSTEFQRLLEESGANES